MMNNNLENKKRLIDFLTSSNYLKTRAVINAFAKVPREEFVLEEYRNYAYANDALPIIKNQTISQPLTVAVMTEALDVHNGMKVLEIGTGSGYQTAILLELAGSKGKVVTIERIHELAEFAKNNLRRCGYRIITIIGLSKQITGFSDEKPVKIDDFVPKSVNLPIADSFHESDKLPIADFSIEKSVKITRKELSKAITNSQSKLVMIEGDGTLGYEKEAPYDRIIVTASAMAVPEKLIEQLKTGGKMIIPIRDEMFCITKGKKLEKQFLGYFAFVPLVGNN